MVNANTQLNIAKTFGVNPVTLITSARYDAGLVKAFNNMTFAYDPNWEYEPGNPTYPLSFFHVKSMTESMSSDISTKPLLFYNSESEATDGTKAGVLNIIADNIVVKPKLYKLEILIPANGTTIRNDNFNVYSADAVKGFIASDGTTSTILGDITSNSLRAGFDAMDMLLRGLYGSELSINSICNMLVNQQDYNKESLDYMWRNRRILKLKMWNGWKFKYLVIQNLDITKIGENGDYYEGTMLCQEVPILTFRKQTSTSVDKLSTISSFIGNKQKEYAKMFIDTMSASMDLMTTDSKHYEATYLL